MSKTYFYLLMSSICVLVISFHAFSLSAKDVTQTQHEQINNKKLQDKITPEEELDLNKRELAFLRNHPVIRVGNEEGWAPFDFNEHGRPKGYAIDHLEILADKLGISLEYINGYSWSELLQLFKEGNIDILPSLWISESRKNYMLFTEPFLKLPYVIVAKNAKNSIEDFSDLKGKKVAVARDYKQEEVLHNNYPQVNTCLVKNALQGLKAVSYGKADAYIGYRGTVDYLIAKNFFTSLEIKDEINVSELGPQGLYIGVQKSMPLLRSALQKAMDTVSEKQKIELAQKWISRENALNISLNKKEKKFLRQHQVLRVNNLMDWPPFDFHENGKPKGFCVDYMQLLADKLNMQIKFVSGPSWNEFLNMLRQGDIDIISDVVETEKRKKYINFSSPYFEIFPGIVLREGHKDLSGISDLSGKKVAVPKQFYLEEILHRHYPKINVESKENILSCIKSVSSGEVTAALAEKPVFDYLINKHFIMDVKSIPIMDNPHFKDIPVSLGVSKERETLMSLLQKAKDIISEEEVKSLKKKWMEVEASASNPLRVTFDSGERNYLARKEKIEMCVHPHWMPFEEMDKSKNHKGIVADIIDLISERIGKRIEPIPAENWQDALHKASSGKCDIVSSLQKTPERQKKFRFTKPYMESVRAIVAKNEKAYVPSISSLAGKEVGIVQGDQIKDYLTDNHPQINTRVLPSIQEVLIQVSKGELDFGIAGLQRISYKLHELGLYDLKIAGHTPFKKFLRIGVNKEEAQLQSILNKAIDSISPREIGRINQKWLAIKYEHGFNYALFWKILAVLAVAGSIILYWNRKLSRLNSEIAKAHEELAQKSKELERLSVTDNLTGLYNRMRLEQILHQEIERTNRYRRPLSLILMDIDNFKDINDTYGHQAGDDILRELARILDQSTRNTDTHGRWGGEEFMIICPESKSGGAQNIAEKLRKVIEEYNFPDIGNITCSFGIAELGSEESMEQLIDRADKCLYKAKREGKNQVVCLD